MCMFKTSPCVGSKRLRVYRQNARMCSTVLNLHTGVFPCVKPRHTTHTPEHKTHIPHTNTHTPTDTHNTPDTTTHTAHTPNTPHKVQTGVAFLVVARMFAPSVGAMSNGAHASASSGGTAWRRRQRRLRAFRRFVLWHSKMEVAAALHHTSRPRTSTTPQFSSTAVEPIAPRVVVPLPHVGEFPGPVYDQFHHEQFAAGEMPENIVDFPVVPGQVIVQAIPEVVVPLPPIEEFNGPVYSHFHQVQFSAGETTENIAEIHVHQEQFPAGEVTENFATIPVVQEQVIVQDIPEVVVPLPPAQEFSAPVYGHVHQVFVGMRPERLVDARRPQRCGRTPPSVRAPVLAVQSLRGFDGVDNTAAKFLLQQALKKKKAEEEEEERRKRERRRRSVWRCMRKLQRPWNVRVSCWSRLARGGRGRGAERRRTPRTSSHSSRSRVRLRQRQWCTLGCFSTVHAVFPSFLDRPKMPCFFGWYGPEGQVCYVVEAALVADIDSGIVLAGFAGFALCFPSLSSGPGFAASCAVWTRRTVLLRDSGFSVEPLVSGSHVQCQPRRRQTGI